MCLANKACPYPEMDNGICAYHNIENSYDFSLHEVTNLNHLYSDKYEHFQSSGMHFEGYGTRNEVRLKLKGCTPDRRERRGRSRVIEEVPVNKVPVVPVRNKIRDNEQKTCQSITHKFTVDGIDCYVTVGLFESGLPGEVFLKISDVERRGNGLGSLAHGMGDAFSIMLSLALQYGVPLQLVISKLSYTRFAPMGMTSSSNKDLKFATSIIDYLVRWMEMRFLKGNGHKEHWANQFTDSQKEQWSSYKNGKDGRRVVSTCNICQPNINFYSLEEGQEHDKKFIVHHQSIHAMKISEKQEAAKATKKNNSDSSGVING